MRNEVTGLINRASAGLLIAGLWAGLASAATPPNLSKVFGEVSILPLGTTTLSFTLTNPNSSTLTGVGFNDTLPVGLVISTPNGLTNPCALPITATAGGNTITLSGTPLTSLQNCTFSVNVNSDGTVLGNVTNTTSAVTSSAGPGAVASAPLFIGNPYQVDYAANLDVAESYVDIANEGTNGAPLLGPGLGPATGNICVNVYAFDPGEELISCCSCLITPNQTVSLGVIADLTSTNVNLTGQPVTSATIKLLATLAPAATGGAPGSGSSCTNTAATITSASIVNGMAAWITHLHPTPATGLILPANTYVTTETPFTPSTLSPPELASITGRCASIIGNGSGFGICRSCGLGALGASKLSH